MSARTRDELMLRRGQLLQRSAQLRLDWSRQVQGLRRPLHLADQARDGVHWLVQHPEWPVGVLVLLLVVRPRRIIGWASTLWWGWGIYRRVQGVVQKVSAAVP